MQQSIWFQTLDLDQQRVLNESQPLPDSADVVIVGAGMIGLATAYYLARAGRKNICILDRGTVLGEASGANAGGLWFGQQSAELGPLSPLAVTSSRLYDALAQEFSFDMERPGMLELLEGDDPAQTGKRLAASDHPFDVEFTGIMRDIHGFDPAGPAPDSGLQLVFEYSAERMVAFEPNT